MSTGASRQVISVEVRPALTVADLRAFVSRLDRLGVDGSAQLRSQAKGLKGTCYRLAVEIEEGAADDGAWHDQI
jgi:hypothetical protein